MCLPRIVRCRPQGRIGQRGGGNDAGHAVSNVLPPITEVGQV